MTALIYCVHGLFASTLHAGFDVDVIKKTSTKVVMTISVVMCHTYAMMTLGRAPKRDLVGRKGVCELA
ncbi:hypothetical protein [Asaia astilbis]